MNEQCRQSQTSGGQESNTEPKKLLGHLKITTKPECSGQKRLRTWDLNYELDGIDIGNRLFGLKFEVDPKKAVVSCEMKIFLTDVEIDADVLAILTTAQNRFGSLPEDERQGDGFLPVL